MPCSKGGASAENTGLSPPLQETLGRGLAATKRPRRISSDMRPGARGRLTPLQGERGGSAQRGTRDGLGGGGLRSAPPPREGCRLKVGKPLPKNDFGPIS